MTSATTHTEPAYEHLVIDPVTPTIGANVEGVSLAGITDEIFAEIHDAFLRHKVLIFRDQHEFTPRDHEAFAARFGELDVPPVALPTCEGAPHVAVIETSVDNKPYVDYWHTDLAYKRRPAMVSVLRSRLVPHTGGDTLWVDMEAAYAGLPEDVRQRIDGLRARNTYARLVDWGPVPQAVIEERLRQFPPQDHPLVRTHAETGRSSLYASVNTVSHIVGLDEGDSAALLDQLFRLSDTPEYQCRVRWTPDTVVLWDNRNTKHYATSDYWPQRRIMERAITIGEVPFHRDGNA
jgi:taurine dioxygenase